MSTFTRGYLLSVALGWTLCAVVMDHSVTGAFLLVALLVLWVVNLNRIGGSNRD